MFDLRNNFDSMFNNALENKLANNNRQTDILQQRANTDLLQANNEFFSGQKQFGLDAFKADTDRGQLAVQSGANPLTSEQLGAVGLGNSSFQTGGRPTGLRSMSMSSSGSLFGGEEEPPGFNKGGCVGPARPKMKLRKMPGYKIGGKVTQPPGPIGNEDADDGTDKRTVNVREGEYLLNPETVSSLGGGDYSQGVRKLNELVRRATGKEPGPTHDEGYAWSGLVGPAGSTGIYEVLPNGQIVDSRPGGAPQQPAAPGVERKFANRPLSAEGAAYERSRMNRATVDAFERPVGEPAPLAKAPAPAPAPAAPRPTLAERSFAAGEKAGTAVKNAFGKAGGAARGAAASVLGGGLEAARLLTDEQQRAFYNDPDVNSFDKLKQVGSTTLDMGLRLGGGALLGGIGSGAGPVGTVAGGLAGYMLGDHAYDGDTDALRDYRTAHPPAAAAPAAPVEAAAPAEAPALVGPAQTADASLSGDGLRRPDWVGANETPDQERMLAEHMSTRDPRGINANRGNWAEVPGGYTKQTGRYDAGRYGDQDVTAEIAADGSTSFTGISNPAGRAAAAAEKQQGDGMRGFIERLAKSPSPQDRAQVVNLMREQMQTSAYMAAASARTTKDRTESNIKFVESWLSDPSPDGKGFQPNKQAVSQFYGFLDQQGIDINTMSPDDAVVMLRGFEAGRKGHRQFDDMYDDPSEDQMSDNQFLPITSTGQTVGLRNLFDSGVGGMNVIRNYGDPIYERSVMHEDAPQRLSQGQLGDFGRDPENPAAMQRALQDMPAIREMILRRQREGQQ